tara:strand:- start:3182 stop:3616 length:435 start_codon:yes stop_codon:yes gene_type:complete
MSKIDKGSSDNELFSYYNENLGEIVQPKSSLLVNCKIENAVSIVVKNLKMIPNYTKYKLNSEFILRTCNLIENLGINKKRDKLVKKDVFIQVFKEIFGSISEEEMKNIICIVDFLLEKKLVKQIPLYKKAVRFVKLNVMPTIFF